MSFVPEDLRVVLIRDDEKDIRTGTSLSEKRCGEGAGSEGEEEGANTNHRSSKIDDERSVGKPGRRRDYLSLDIGR